MRASLVTRAVFRRIAPAALILAAAAGAVLAGAAREYAYLHLQGRLADPRAGRPIEGATVRLSDGARTFEARTDAQGVFVFDRLPVAAYELRLVTPSGAVLRSARPVDPADAHGARLRVKTGKGGAGVTIRIEPGPQAVSVIAPDATQWNKLWAEVGVFVGLAALLAL